jgi:hypothetical protein
MAGAEDVAPRNARRLRENRFKKVAGRFPGVSLLLMI